MSLWSEMLGSVGGALAQGIAQMADPAALAQGAKELLQQKIAEHFKSSRDVARALDLAVAESLRCIEVAPGRSMDSDSNGQKRICGQLREASAGAILQAQASG